MIHVRFEPIGITVKIKKGETLLDGIHDADFFAETPCGGMGICGECLVQVSPAELVPHTPHQNISTTAASKGFRLACQAVPKGDICVQLPDSLISKTKNRPHTRIHTQSLDSTNLEIDPAVKLTQTNDVVQLSHYGDPVQVNLDSWKKNFTPKGLAIDIGTTTLALSLVCLSTGKILKTASALNPQVTFGYDVLTRIQYAKTPQKIKELATLVQDMLNSLLDDVCSATGSQSDEIIDLCVGANTTMLQLAAGIDSASLGRSPFRYTIKGGRSYPASMFGLNVNKAAQIYLPPILHAFIGSDISSGLTLCPDFFNPDKIILFVDIGTNGEICLNVRGKRHAVSTAAGPAFEGMGISSGMRAENGAIEHVDVQDGKFKCQTIGNIKPTGICGSGIVDLVAELLRSGYMDRSGRLNKKQSPENLIIDTDGVPAFKFCQGLCFTQKDIRQIQLAVSAIRTGIDFILKQAKIIKTQIDTVYLAGGFGAYLRIENLSRIGIFDVHMAEKTITCGNTSLLGSTYLLINGKQRDFIEHALSKITYLSLAEAPGFMDTFIANLNFPE